MASGIYKFVNKRTSETYVGQSMSIGPRIGHHFKGLTTNSHHNKGMQEDWNNGDRFVYEILEETPEDRSILHEKEVIWIMRLNTFYEGYNQTPGGIYDQSKGNIGHGGGRLPEYKYEPYEKSSQNLKKENLTIDELISKGRELCDLKKYEEGIECYNKALDINPQNDYLWFIKGISLVRLGKNQEKNQEAIECYNKALKINPQNDTAWTSKGISLQFLGKREEAIECYNKALEINPQDNIAWNSKGISLYCLGKNHEAIECYNKALEINPQYYSAWNNKGNSLFLLGKNHEAIECYNKALEINPHYDTARYNKENSLYFLGKNEESIKCYNKALKEKEDLINHLKRKTDDEEIIKNITQQINNNTITKRWKISEEIKKQQNKK